LPKAEGEPLFERYQMLGSEGSIVLDTQTQLAWQRCVDGQSWSADTSNCDGNAQLYSWDAALAYSDSQQQTTGFRLPTASELATLVYCSDRHSSSDLIGTDIEGQLCGLAAQTPTVRFEVFPSLEQRTYWTSSATPDAETKRGVSFASGSISEANSPLSSYPVLLVREAESSGE
jgi:uncharacterized protein (TIGR02145 family)